MDGKDEQDLGADAAVVAGAGSIDRAAASHVAPKHTRGQWSVVRGSRQGRDGSPYGVEVAARLSMDRRSWESSGYIPIADIYCGANPISVADFGDPAIKAEIDATRDANAHLIAAAPDLYAALKSAPDIHDYIVDDGEDTMGVQIIRFSRDFSVWSQRAKAALAKAEEPS